MSTKKENGEEGNIEGEVKRKQNDERSNKRVLLNVKRLCRRGIRLATYSLASFSNYMVTLKSYNLLMNEKRQRGGGSLKGRGGESERMEGTKLEQTF